jgi:hypothetical protein
MMGDKNQVSRFSAGFMSRDAAGLFLRGQTLPFIG